MNAAPVGRTPVPSAFEVRELFAGLLGRDIEWTTGTSPVDPIEGAVVGAYVNDAGEVRAVVVLDIPLAVWAGSAIALLPHSGAESSIKTGLISAAQFENVAEILNVASSMFNRAGSPHLRLDAPYAPREKLPDDVAKWVLEPANRLDGTVAIQGYGGGNISAVAAY